MVKLGRPGNYFLLLPWIAFIPWYGMLIAMLVCWAAQGHPIYWFMHTEQFPVYISDIGATNLRPLFIACSGWQGLGYVFMIACEFFQRAGHWPFRLRNKRSAALDESDFNQMSAYSQRLLSGKYLMPPYFTKDERNLIFASFIMGCISQLGLLFLTIFSTAKYNKVHKAMLGVFIAFLFISICCYITEYFLLGRHYASVHPLAKAHADANVPTVVDPLTNASRIDIDRIPWNKWTGYTWNKFTISATSLVIWLTLAVIWAICFGAINDNSKSAAFEWLLAFWFGLLFVIISINFYMGSRYKHSKYFKRVETFAGYYKYDRMVYPDEISVSTKQESYTKSPTDSSLVSSGMVSPDAERPRQYDANTALYDTRNYTTH